MELLWLLLLGLGTGTFGVLVGTGGGLILVPMLLLFSEMDAQVVAGTSLALVAINSFSGATAYRRLGLVDRRSGLLFAGAAIPGSIIAPFVLKSVDGDTFRLLFGLLLVGLAVQMLVRTRFHISTAAGILLGGLAAHLPARVRNNPGPSKRSRELASVMRTSREITTRTGQVFRYEFNEVLATSFNLLLGFISAFFGTGGGFVRTPVLVATFKFPVRVAVATSVFALAFYATAGSIVHASLGNVDWYPTLVWVGLGVVVGSQAGARLAAWIKSIWIFRLLIALLLAMGVRLLLQGLLA